LCIFHAHVFLENKVTIILHDFNFTMDILCRGQMQLYKAKRILD
jgi:hypothetical protein